MTKSNDFPGERPTRLLFVFGTRPEAIKMAPVIRRLRGDADRFLVRVCVTGQHRRMLDQVLELFDITPDHDLGLMQTRQTLTDITTGILRDLERVIARESPDWVVVQGDTTSTFAGSLAAFYAGVRVAHVEAGLRTGDFAAPFPEEMNRVLTSRIASLHFAPTEVARRNLLKENIPAPSIHVTGNTVVDALLEVVTRIGRDEALRSELSSRFAYLDQNRQLVLATAHRRENFGDGFDAICRGLARVAEENPRAEILFPVHLNPNVREPVLRMLGGTNRIHLIEPVNYLEMVYLIDRSQLIITDSGGIQEEAPALGKPVLVLRATTERPEGVYAGNAVLVGSDEDLLAREAASILSDRARREMMSQEVRPYGSGDASVRIAEVFTALHDDPAAGAPSSLSQHAKRKSPARTAVD